ncbi:MAG: hypothetical protein LC722_04810 [Actinobacteria bacterium]|nr:hypothetical protein [Actinomycetota bacterium]
MRKIGKGLGVIVGALSLMVVSAVAAFATPPDPATVVSGSAESLKNSLLDIAVAVLPYAAILLAVTIGWRFARKFVRG